MAFPQHNSLKKIDHQTPVIIALQCSAESTSVAAIKTFTSTSLFLPQLSNDVVDTKVELPSWQARGSPRITLCCCCRLLLP